jgi:hypothetical protein
LKRRIERQNAVLVRHPAADEDDVVAQRRQDVVAPRCVVAHDEKQRVLKLFFIQMIIKSKVLRNSATYLQNLLTTNYEVKERVLKKCYVN